MISNERITFDGPGTGSASIEAVKYKKSDKVMIAGITMEIRENRGTWWLGSPYHENDEIFIKLLIEDPMQYIESIVGCRPGPGIFPEVQTLEDLNKVIAALEQYPVPEQSQLKYKKSDKVMIAGIAMEVNETHGDWWLSSFFHGKDEIFTKLQIKDRMRYIESIIGYTPRRGGFPSVQTPRRGGFPSVQTLEDLNKVIAALEQHPVPEQSQLKYKMGDEVTIAGITLKVTNWNQEWWLGFLNSKNTIRNSDSVVFTGLRIEKPMQYIESIVGYRPRPGFFPSVQTLEDLNKVIAALEQHPVSKTPTHSEQSVKGPSESELYALRILENAKQDADCFLFRWKIPNYLFNLPRGKVLTSGKDSYINLDGKIFNISTLKWVPKDFLITGVLKNIEEQE